MKPLNCAATRRRLNAFYDRELAISDQIAVSAHLEWCDECAEALDAMRAVGRIVQNVGHGRMALEAMTNEEAAAFNAAVVNRVKAERQVSLTTQVRALFEDMHLVYAGAGAAVALLVSIVIMLSMMRFATNERPDSLAAIVNVLATPLECEPGVDPSASACHERWTGRFQRANESAEQDASNHLASSPKPAEPAMQMTMFTPLSQRIVDRLREADLNNLTPLEALNLLAELKKEI